MATIGIWDDPGPDSGWSWVIAFGTCWITFCSYGFSRSCGVLFVATLETFQVSRQEASWPFNLAPAVACFSAIVAGFLNRHLSTRQTVLIAAFLCSLGVALCFFATSTTWIVACYGIIYGFGIALCVPVLLGILNEYFVRHRATANGIYLSGSTLGLFSIPPLLEYLISVYGLRGTMLLQSGLVMHIFVGALLLRGRTPENFPILVRRLKATKDRDREVTKELLEVEESSRVFRLNSETGSFKADTQTKDNGVPHDTELTHENNAEVDNIEVPETPEEEALVLVSRQSSVLTKGSSKSLSRRNTEHSIDGKSTAQVSFKGSLTSDLDVLGALSKENISMNGDAQPPKSTYFSILKDIFTDPCFYMVLVSGAACIVPLFTFMMIIMDFGMDRGLPREKAVLIMSAISIPELLGRFCFGWISDKGYLKYKTLFMISKSVGGLLLLILPTLGYDAGLYVISGCFGAVESCAVTILNVLFVEYLGLEKLAIAFSWSIFFDGFIFLGMPTVIGLFRDNFQSYDYLFYLLAALNMLSVVVWFLEPPVVRARARRNDSNKRKRTNVK